MRALTIIAALLVSAASGFAYGRRLGIDATWRLVSATYVCEDREWR